MERYKNLQQIPYDIVDHTGNYIKTLTVSQSWASIKKEDVIGDNDTYHKVSESDRFDLLAYYFYNDETYWWVIMVANDITLPTHLTNGMILRIPMSISKIQHVINKKQQEAE
jgi:hypothetical protein